MQVVEEEYEVKQMRDMAAARKRWEALVIFENFWGEREREMLVSLSEFP